MNFGKRSIKTLSSLLVIALANAWMAPFAMANARPLGRMDGDGNEEGDPINIYTGNRWFVELDISLPTPGLPLTFSRRYNSRETYYEGPLGKGWSHSMDWHISETMELVNNFTPPKYDNGVVGARIMLAKSEGSVDSTAYDLGTVSHGSDSNLRMVPVGVAGFQSRAIPMDTYVMQDAGSSFLAFESGEITMERIGDRPAAVIDGITAANGAALPVVGMNYSAAEFSVGDTIPAPKIASYASAIPDTDIQSGIDRENTRYSLRAHEDKIRAVALGSGQAADLNAFEHRQPDNTLLKAATAENYGSVRSCESALTGAFDAYADTPVAQVHRPSFSIGTSSGGEWSDSGVTYASARTSLKEYHDAVVATAQAGGSSFAAFELKDAAGAVVSHAEVGYDQIRTAVKNFEDGLDYAADNSLSLGGISSKVNAWIELFNGDGNRVTFNQKSDGIYYADDDNWTIEKDGELFVLKQPGGMERVFNAQGRMTAIRDLWGNAITLSYTDGKLQRAEHSNGQALVFTYVGDRLDRVDVSADLYVKFGYNTDDQLDSATRYVNGEAFAFDYQYTENLLTKKTNPAGHEYNFTYETAIDNNVFDEWSHGARFVTADGSGGGATLGYHPTVGEPRLTHRGTGLDINGHWVPETVEYVNDTTRRMTFPARGQNAVYEHHYSSKTQMREYKYGPGVDLTDARTRGFHYQYNGEDMTEEKQFDTALGETFSTYMAYDDRHNVTNLSIAYNGADPQPVMSAGYNEELNLPVWVEDADGHRAETVYTNGHVAVIKEFYTETQSHDTHFTYYADGQLQQIRNANEHTVGFTYDANGYPDTVTPLVGPQLKTIYDAYGNPDTAEVLAESGQSTGRTVDFDYTAQGWLERTTFADGRGITNDYNAMGYVTNRIDRAGRHTDYTYAPTRKLTSVTRYLENTDGSQTPHRIAFDYDEQFNTVSITEPNQRTVEGYAMDIQDRVTSITNIDEQVMHIDYGLGDMVRKITRFDGSAITNTYDDRGRLESAAYYHVGQASLPAQTVAFSYYPDSQLKSIADDASGITNSYDWLNRLTSTTTSVATVSTVANYQYDLIGNVTNAIVSVGGASTTSTAYEYDAAERLTNISTTERSGDQGGATAEAQSFIYSYSPENGLVATVSNTVSGIATTYAYDLLDRATNITYTASDGSLIQSIDYAYDAASMITNKVQALGNGQEAQVAYAYDSLDRLIGETRTVGGTSSTSSLVYNYDLAGNRTSVIDNGTTNTYALGTGNRLATWGTQGSALYDAAGNTTNLVSNDGTELDLEWDERYRLTSAVRDSLFDIRYSYDVLGRKVSRIAGGSPATAEYYIYNGNQVVADLDASGNLLRTYVWGKGIDNLLSFTDHASNATYYPVKDHQNTVLALVDGSGSVVESYDYDAYGNVLDVRNSLGASIANQQSAIGNRYT
ncbi:DUF6531 domain-containing protein, partial [Pontiella sp.]|uniref:DUF6531 domain-containing protein n=1 Tax=Pontiella sp. TaxID=2837462 RepID=UPI0035618775